MVLRDLFGTDAKPRFAELAWQPFHEGVEIVRLHGDGSVGPSAALLRYQPGASIPTHKHSGYEHILVLAGAQRDQRERYDVGTLVIHGHDTEHTVASEDGCVVLAIWQAPVRFTGLRVRVGEPERVRVGEPEEETP